MAKVYMSVDVAAFITGNHSIKEHAQKGRLEVIKKDDRYVIPLTFDGEYMEQLARDTMLNVE